MMERREQERRPRRVQVSFWQRGASKRYRGYSANISIGGMYIDTNSLVPRGSRIRLEVGSAGNTFVAEAVVARVNKSLQTLRTSGMGVRFLTIDELVSELIPEIASVAPDKRQMPSAVGESPLPEGAFRLRFVDGSQFLEVFRRDLSTGGLFIPTDQPAALNEVITVEVSVDEPGLAPVRLEARVVHRLDPDMPDGTGGGNLMAGIGVEILSFENALASLRSIVDQLEKA